MAFESTVGEFIDGARATTACGFTIHGDVGVAEIHAVCMSWTHEKTKLDVAACVASPNEVAVLVILENRARSDMTVGFFGYVSESSSV